MRKLYPLLIILVGLLIFVSCSPPTVKMVIEKEILDLLEWEPSAWEGQEGIVKVVENKDGGITIWVDKDVYEKYGGDALKEELADAVKTLQEE